VTPAKTVTAGGPARLVDGSIAAMRSRVRLESRGGWLYRWLATGLLACVGCDSGTVPPAPLAASIGISPDGTGILAGATEARFTALVTNGAGRSLSYEWDFGDGTRATEAAPSHVFAPGSFEVALTVRSGDGGVASARRTVVSRTIDGTWRGQTFNWVFELRQEGRGITGRVLGQGDLRYSGTVPLQGTIDAPNVIRFTVPNFPPLGFTGPPDAGVEHMTGQIEFQIPRPETLVRTQP
jgi:PKD domain-containing protein